MGAVSTIYTYESLRTLPPAELLALWRELDAPTLEEMEGEYEGSMVPPVAIKHAENRKLNGPGEWIAKGFSAIPHREYPGQGYNVWFTPGRIIRSVRYATEVAPSRIDGRSALLLHYSPFRHHNTNTGLMNDIRKVEPGLYIGTITTGVDTELFGPVDPATGRSRPEPFVLRGPLAEWRGVDDPKTELLPEN